MFEICSDIKPDTLSGAAEAPVANNVAAAINRDVRIMMSRRQVCEAKPGSLELITKIHPLQLFAGISAPISRGGKNCNARTFALSFAQARRHDDFSPCQNGTTTGNTPSSQPLHFFWLQPRRPRLGPVTKVP